VAPLRTVHAGVIRKPSAAVLLAVLPFLSFVRRVGPFGLVSLTVTGCASATPADDAGLSESSAEAASGSNESAASEESEDASESPSGSTEADASDASSGGSSESATSRPGTAESSEAEDDANSTGSAGDGGSTTSTSAGESDESDTSEASSGDPDSGDLDSGDSNGDPSWYPCDGDTADYDVVMTKSGSTWSVTRGGDEAYSGSDMEDALLAAYASLSQGRTTKESILVQGDGDISASSQVAIPSYTILNVCGTLNVSGSPPAGDVSPMFARGRTDIDIPNLTMTGSPSYGMFFRESDNIHLGQIELRLTGEAGIGIRVDSGPNAGSETSFHQNLTIDYVYGTGMGSHIVETYGIDGIRIGTVEGDDVGECGLLLNRSINAEVELVTCEGCGTGTGYAAFRVANDVGKIGNEYPEGNIHVGKVFARGGGRGIFSVSGCGGLIIDEIDIADTGNTSILFQNTYNTTIAAVSGTVDGGEIAITNDTENTESGRYPPTENVHVQNLTLSGGASVVQSWCAEFGANGCTATNITGGTVDMCD